ncbi:MAG: hypothetical protein HKN60_02145, partial [Rhizobiales bacterium]|nr:hypothetical protein [Hyphomicrobiales bacterium]
MRFKNAVRRRFGVIAFAIIMTASAAAPAATPSISHSTLKSLFPGKFAVSVSGVSVRMVAASNGYLTGTSFAGTDTGRWSVRSGKLCIMLRDWFDGQTRCSRVVRDGKWY